MQCFIFHPILFVFQILLICGQTKVTDTLDNGCECVPFYLCSTNTNGQGIIDIRTRTSNDCPAYGEYCCKHSDLIFTRQTNRIPPPQARGCGYRNPNGVGFKIPGNLNNETQFGEFPWMVAIFLKKENDAKHFYKCGGSLIHPQVALTAAHCVTDNGTYKVRAGEWDSQTVEEMYHHEDREVASIIKHPRYHSGKLYYDVALLFLSSPIELVAHINVACLPPQGTVVIFDKCFVTGWGKQNSTEQSLLKKIELPLVGRGKCQKAFRNTRLGKKFQLHRSIMCAGGEEGKDACIGDGGGPLVCPMRGQEDRYEQVGIVSWGIGCGTKGVPGAYVDVAYVRNWIDRKLSARHIDINQYYN